MRRLWAAYSEALRVRPLRTNVASAGAIMFVGDSAAQQIELRRDGALAHCQDFGRTATMTSWNALFFAPFFFYWMRGGRRLMIWNGCCGGSVCLRRWWSTMPAQSLL
eukprot:gnl/TRDRNA2_/TRDRNA2_49872_c0_seq1.p2 gnl/TRDRNA2_/TRDRNA2_49872_c0~~gnl/TRDRNA2_/TRDRNA2_49872_c0_seq1.p2  ORF type:complete len:107 (-),score=5.76 gnl/TRDRNA2_/TRDRNA2_49872_c0_seq1:380-700(-)